MTLPRTILVPTDFSDAAGDALEYAVELAVRLDATIHLLHVVTIPTLGVAEVGLAYRNAMFESVLVETQRALDGLAQRYRDRVKLGPVRQEVGDARDVIDRVAAQLEADLIVMGTHGRRGVQRVLMGSVAEQVVRTAPCPVLTIRHEI